MNRCTKIDCIRLVLVLALVPCHGCLRDDIEKGAAQVIYVTTPEQCLSCGHAWQLFECIRSHHSPSEVRLAAVLLCNRQVEAANWKYANAVDTVVVSTPNRPSQLYAGLSDLGDYQLFVLRGRKLIGCWKATALTGDICDSVLRMIERNPVP